MESVKRINIGGGIGAGKTTLAKDLAKKRGFRVCEEPSSENEYLNDFYEDKAAHAFAAQVAFLAARFQQHSEVMGALKPGEGVVTDRGPFEDVIFARMLNNLGKIDDRDFRTYLKLFNMLTSTIGSEIPDLVILLDVSVDELMRRIKLRGRSCEKGGGVDRAYLVKLSDQYNQYAEEMGRRTTVIRVDWNDFHDTDTLWAAVQQAYGKGEKGVKTLVL